MSNKKDIRKNFRDSVFKRDKYKCKICGMGPFTYNPEEYFDAHHITDRGEMPNGGYVKENGITVCKFPHGLEKRSCHQRVELFHLSEGLMFDEGLHPNDLYKMIKSSKELATNKSMEL